MVRIKVEYDKYNRTFTLLNREFGSVLEDGAQYELLVPLMLEDLDEEKHLVLISSSTALTHA